MKRKLRRPKIPPGKISPVLQSLVSSAIQNPDNNTVEQLNQWTGTIEEKTASIVWMMKQLNYEVAKANLLIKKIRSIRDIRENIREILTEYLVNTLVKNNIANINVDRWKITITDDKPDVKIDDVKQLPKDLVFRQVEVSLNPLWNKIRKRLMAGKTVPGAHLKEGGKILKVR